MDGIAADGGELAQENLSREARVRAAYMEWCKDFGKETDEERFATFSSNYLAMEQYAQENGKSMQLNKYADCTEEEYIALTSGVKEVEDTKAAEEAKEIAAKEIAEEKAAAEAKKAEEEAAKKEAAAKAEAEAKKAEEAAEKEAAAKAEAEAKKAEEEAAAKKAAAEAKAKKAEEAAKKGKTL